jgi:hypothetical protein
LDCGLAEFLLIAAGLSYGFFSNQESSVTYIATASGVIVEFISGVFFYLYNRTVKQMKEYHDSLLDVQNILLSFKLVGDTKAKTAKALMVAQMLTFLVGGRNAMPPPDESPVLNGAGNNSDVNHSAESAEEHSRGGT